MNITDEMVKAYAAAYEAAPPGPTQSGALRAGLAAVAPLIAAQALRDAAAIRGGCSACRPGTGCNA